MPFRFASWGLSKEDFFDGVSDPVNKELMDIFVQCGIVDRSGHGVPKVVKHMAEKYLNSLVLE